MALKSTSKKTRKPAAEARADVAGTTTVKRTARSKSTAAKPVRSASSVTFSIFAPEAASVQLAGDFTRWENEPVSLRREKSGVWKATLPLAPGRYEYRLLVDGQWQNDPECTEFQPNSFGSANCVCSVAA